MANKFSRSVAVSTIVTTAVTDPEAGTVITATGKKKFSRDQPSTSAYLEAIAATAPLTMLTAAETRLLSKAGEKETAAEEDVIYKYREEFLHIQKVSENGVTALGVIVADTAEFKRVATNWGFAALVENKYKTDVVVGKNLARTEVKTLLSNVTVDWSKPKKPTIDVEYYRQSGNIVNTTAVKTSPLAAIKAKYQLGVYPSTTLTGNVYVKSDEYQSFAINSFRYFGSGSGAVFNVIANALEGVGQAYQFGLVGSAGGGVNYTAGESLLIPGTSLGGTTPLNDAVITILTVNSTGTVVSARIIGTTSNNFLSNLAGLA
jgi:hypothetical protein